MIMSKRIHKNPVRVAAVLLAFILTFGCIGVVPARAAEPNIAQFTTSSGEVRSYTSLSTAITAASLFGRPTIYLTGNYTLPGDLAIPALQTVVIPTSDAYNDTETGVANVSGNGTTGEAHVTLTVPDGVNLEVNGTLLVAGNQQSTQPRTGFLTGAYGAINLEGNLIVNGTLYARGEISGTGTVTANKGGTVYQRFQIADWRGGTESQNAYTDSDGEEEGDHRVFPFNLYDLGGITANQTYMNGSSLYGQAYVRASIFQFNINVPYFNTLDDDEYLVKFTGDGGSIHMSRDGDLTTITIDGAALTSGGLTFSSYGYDFNSKGLECPFGYNTKVELVNGSVLNVQTLLKILPGCTMTVDETSTLDVTSAGAMYFYAEKTFSENYFFHPYGTTWDYDAAATLTNSGTVTVEGILGSTDVNFSNITGTNLTANDTVTIYEYQQNVGPQEVEFHVYTPNPTPTPDPDPTPAE